MPATAPTQSAIQFLPATREGLYLRAAFHGPGGSGKTYTALMILNALCERVAVVDTEKGKSRKYVGHQGWEFNIWQPQTFSPESLIEALAVAAATGHDGILVDSGSKYWSGKGGMLERVDRATSSSGRKDIFGSGWKTMSPIEDQMFDALMSFPGHVIMNLRVKTEYVIEEVERDGRTTKQPVKIGLRPDQRREFDYDFDLVGALDRENTLTVMKSDILTIPQNSMIPKPDLVLADTIRDFCAEGDQLPSPLVYRDQILAEGTTIEVLWEIRQDVLNRGLGNAAVIDGEGKPTLLEELLNSRARELQPRPQARTAARPQQLRSASGPGDNGQQSPQDKLRSAVTYMLRPQTLAVADQRMTWIAKQADMQGKLVGDLVDQDSAELLGLDDASRAKVTLVDLAELVCGYIDRHQTPVVAVQQGTATDSAQLTEAAAS